MDLVVFVQNGLHLLDVVHGVEYDIVGRMTDADAEAVPLQQSEIGKIVHKSLEDATGFLPSVCAPGYSGYILFTHTSFEVGIAYFIATGDIGETDGIIGLVVEHIMDFHTLAPGSMKIDVP